MEVELQPDDGELDVSNERVVDSDSLLQPFRAEYLHSGTPGAWRVPGWNYYRYRMTRRGPVEERVHHKVYSASQLQSPHFQQLRQEAEAGGFGEALSNPALLMEPKASLRSQNSGLFLRAPGVSHDFASLGWS